MKPTPSMKLYIWHPASLADHTDGVLVVMARSKAEAIKLGAAAMAGRVPPDRAARAVWAQRFESNATELRGIGCEIKCGPTAVVQYGGG